MISAGSSQTKKSDAYLQRIPSTHTRPLLLYRGGFGNTRFAPGAGGEKPLSILFPNGGEVKPPETSKQRGIPGTHLGRNTRPRLSRPLKRSFPRSADDVIARTVLVSPTSTCRMRSRFRRTLTLSLLKTWQLEGRKAVCRNSNLLQSRLLKLRMLFNKSCTISRSALSENEGARAAT